MDVAERTRLEKLLGMLGSAFDGERANAARMISDMVARKKLTIVELIFGPPKQKSSYRRYEPPPRQERAKVNKILQALKEIADQADNLEFVLTEWECQFAADVAARYESDYELSPKQVITAEKIIKKYERSR